MGDSTSQSRLTLENKGKFYLVALPNRLGQKEADSLLGIKNAMEKRPGAHLVLDFSDTQFLDSRSVGQLALLNKSIAGTGGSLRFACVPERIFNLLNMTRILDSVTVHSNLESVETAFPA